MRHGRDLRRLAVGAFALLLAGTAQAGVKEGVEAWQAKNYAKAVAEWRGPANAGDSDAQFNLAQAYKLGRGVSADPKLAQSWYERAAIQGHEQAQANLGLILFQNGDRQAAMPWIRKAADQGEPRAQYVLGTAFFNGDLAAKDWPRAYALMTRAAAAGLPQAVSSLSQMDQYVSLADRQQGIAMAKEMEHGTMVAPAQPTPVPATSAAAAARPQPKALTPAPAYTAQQPAPTTIQATSVPKPGGKWRIQLAAVPNTKAANERWAKLKTRPELAGLQLMPQDMGQFTRLQAGPIANRTDANRICQSLSKSGLACFPVSP